MMCCMVLYGIVCMHDNVGGLKAWQCAARAARSCSCSAKLGQLCALSWWRTNNTAPHVLLAVVAVSRSQSLPRLSSEGYVYFHNLFNSLWNRDYLGCCCTRVTIRLFMPTDRVAIACDLHTPIILAYCIVLYVRFCSIVYETIRFCPRVGCVVVEMSIVPSKMPTAVYVDSTSWRQGSEAHERRKASRY